MTRLPAKVFLYENNSDHTINSSQKVKCFTHTLCTTTAGLPSTKNRGIMMPGAAARCAHRAGQRPPSADTTQPGPSDLGVAKAVTVRVKHLTCLPVKVFQCYNYSDHTINSSQKVKCFTHTPSLPSTRNLGRHDIRHCCSPRTPSW